MSNSNPTNHQLTGDPVDSFSEITERLADSGWAVVDNFIPAEWADELREEQQKLARSNAFRAAGVCRENAYRLDTETRCDQILWLDHAIGLPAQRQYLNLMEQYRLAVNRDLGLGLFDVERFAAIYPPGGFYKRHLDCFQVGNRRALTAILYLTPRWSERDGGALRIYLDAQQAGQHTDILPQSGRLVTFISDRFYHEVLPTQRERYSITSWFSHRQ